MSRPPSPDSHNSLSRNPGTVQLRFDGSEIKTSIREEVPSRLLGFGIQSAKHGRSARMGPINHRSPERVGPCEVDHVLSRDSGAEIPARRRDIPETPLCCRPTSGRSGRKERLTRYGVRNANQRVGVRMRAGHAERRESTRLRPPHCPWLPFSYAMNSGGAFVDRMCLVCDPRLAVRT